MSAQERETDRDSFLLPKGCSDLIDALGLKRRAAAQRSKLRKLSQTRIASAFAQWLRWIEALPESGSVDAQDPELRRLVEIAALLTAGERTQLKKQISKHPLARRSRLGTIKILLRLFA